MIGDGQKLAKSYLEVGTERESSLTPVIRQRADTYIARRGA